MSPSTLDIVGQDLADRNHEATEQLLNRLVKILNDLDEERRTACLTWVSVESELPDDDTTVLIALSDGEVWTGFLDAGDWRFVCGELVDQGEGTRVLHWADYPEPPTMNQKNHERNNSQ